MLEKRHTKIEKSEIQNVGTLLFFQTFPQHKCFTIMYKLYVLNTQILNPISTLHNTTIHLNLYVHF